MGIVAFDITMSLDGFVTGPNDGVERPLGDGGERLHEWIYELAGWRERHGHAGGDTNADSEVIDESFSTAGAILMGKRMFSVGEGPWGADPPFRMPVFVVTHHVQETLAKQRKARPPCRSRHPSFDV